MLCWVLMEDVENMDGNLKEDENQAIKCKILWTWTKKTYSLWSEGFWEAVGGCTVMAMDP